MISIIKILDKVASKYKIPRDKVARLLSMKTDTYRCMINGSVSLTKYRLDQLIDFLDLKIYTKAIYQWHDRYKTYCHLQTMASLKHVDDVTLQAFSSFIFFNEKLTPEEKRKINETILTFCIPHIESLPEHMARIASDLYYDRANKNNRTQ